MDWYATGPHATIMQALQATYIPPGCLGRVSIELQIWRVIIAIVCGALAATLASAGGIGGGGLYVPIFNLLLGLNSNTSAALSSCMILGGTSVNLVWYSFRRREDGRGPLIDYQVSLLCLPNVLLGITAGVICNVASPSWLITVLLIIVLSLMTYRCFRNAFGRWNCETSALHSVNIRSGSAKDAGCDYVVDNDVFESCDNVSDQKWRNEELEKPLLEYSEMRRQPQYPLLKITSLLLVWVVFLAVQVVRGSSDNQNLFGIKTCGAVYWTVTFIQVPFTFLVTLFALMYLQRKSLGVDVMENMASGGLVKLGLLPMCALGAGFLGGMLGLGGGTIISPLLLEFGMNPQHTAATCSFMVFFSSSLSMIQYWLLGLIPLEYALISVAVSFVFSILGLAVVQSIILKYGRVSLIVFSVSLVMGISAGFMAFFGIWDVIRQIQQGDYMGFVSPC